MTGEETASAASDASTARERAEFDRLVAPLRRELRVHCYRMVGSFDDAEDLVQEAMLRAWRRRETYEARAPFRAWMYKIATNTCLDRLRREPRRAAVAIDADGVPRYDAVPWLQPVPDAVLDAAEPDDTQPEAVAVRRETIALAYLAAIQVLPARQRAVLLLRDVLAFSADETAGLLDMTVASANSALQRARATMRARRADDALSRSLGTASHDEQALLDRYMRAHEQSDPDAIIAVLRDDARLTVSPNGLGWSGRDEIAPTYRASMGSLGEWRSIPTRANRQPAVAHYLRRFGDDRFLPFSIVVLEIADGRIGEIATFTDTSLFAAFGLPGTFPESPAGDR